MVALSLALALAALAAPAEAANGGQADRASSAHRQSLEVWAYFDGDTPVSRGEVRAYANGRRLRERGDGPGPVTTFSGGQALLRFNSLPSTLRIVVSGGRAGGERVDGSLRTKVRGVTDGEIVHVNPVTTVSVLAHAEDGPGLRRERNRTERTLGIRPILDDHDLYATDRWFEGDRFLRWTMEQGSVGAGAWDLVELIDQPGFDHRPFLAPDGEGPEARAATSGGASARDALDRLAAAPSARGTAKEVINGLIDGINGAAGLTGPQGFAVSAVALFFKTVVGLALEDPGDQDGGQDKVSAALRAISAQITELQNRIDNKFLQLQIADIDKTVTKIKTTQAEFLSMLKWAGDMDNAQSETARERAKVGLIQRTQNFLNAAQLRLQDATELDEALRVVQTGTDTAGNTFKRPPLIPAVREQLGAAHFWTNESSERLRGFFNYYEWVQTQLATVLTEFYMLGGSCAVSFVASHPNQLLTSNDCSPRDGVATEDVAKIRDNIEKQRATLPPKVLDPRVFIDMNTRRVWLTNLTTRSAREIVTDRGLVVEECPGGTPRTRTEPCRAALWNNKYSFDFDSQLGWGNGVWHIPTANDYRGLFGGPGPSGAGAPLARLNWLGVRQNGGPINWPYFWLAGDFYVEMNGGIISIRGQNRVEAVVFKLPAGAAQPETQRLTVGTGCDWDSRRVGNDTVYTPQCSGKWYTGHWNTDFSAHILHYRAGTLTDAQGAAYWCNPSRQPSWDPAKC